jgi:hypothetical protein
MGISMRTRIAILAVVASFSAEAVEGGREWLVPSPSPQSFEAAIDIPPTDIYEVVASKEYAAVLGDLKERAFVKISETQAQYYTGHYFQRKAGQTTYLVRAVNSNGGTGNYTVKRSGSMLLVYHGSLGSPRSIERSALVVNVDFDVEQVRVSSGGAM